MFRLIKNGLLKNLEIVKSKRKKKERMIYFKTEDSSWHIYVYKHIYIFTGVFSVFEQKFHSLSWIFIPQKTKIPQIQTNRPPAEKLERCKVPPLRFKEHA